MPQSAMEREDRQIAAPPGAEQPLRDRDGSLVAGA
jgi:hypothetical protein